MSDDPIRDALRMMRYGFYAITSRNDDEVNAMVANWLIQVSFEPRLVAMGLQKTSYSYDVIREGGVFAINLFKAEDADFIRPFTKSRTKNPAKMEEATYTAAPVTGCPVLEGAAAYIECKMKELLNIGGDHDILIGEPVGAAVLKPAEVDEILSLADLGWKYGG